MGAPEAQDRYEIGLAVVGTRVALVFRRGRRQRVVTFDTDAPHAHAAAVAGIRRACSEPLAEALPRVIYLRQKSAIGSCAGELVAARASLVWSSPKAEGGEHLLVTQAAVIALSAASRVAA